MHRMPHAQERRPTNNTTRSAFARRLSKRMRHMQSPDEPSQRPQTSQSPAPSQPQTHYPQSPPPKPSQNIPSPSSEKTTSPPIDSAYASSGERQPPPSYEPRRGAPMEEPRQPIKGFTLFPRTHQPIAQAAPATLASKKDDWAVDGDHKSVATSMSKGRSFGSMRRYLHLRKGSRVAS